MIDFLTSIHYNFFVPLYSVIAVVYFYVGTLFAGLSVFAIVRSFVRETDGKNDTADVLFILLTAFVIVSNIFIAHFIFAE